ncbi:FecR family protein [Chitinophaga niabensis]|uniref:Ferric-dicitrate binding protein FerR, regulates iron transport through sigma-19 n=1 Tax=Chitinophaga niabensis TaxID=536979 RepID=A0A1N6GJD7_9BACT|nr:FecR domain-containing protein [Chitinophaga niabensis]SIO07629.1 ferric-dicitrate binding protein FerR, regulates iron transport through sigma-19 [Chitinophaga niabensis]
MPDRYEIEQLVINDSFINYCFNRNPSDTAHWKNYLSEHPEEAATFAEARELVLGISLMLIETKEEEETAVIPMHPRRKNLQTLFAAAAIAAVIAVSTFFLFRNKPEVSTPQLYAFSTALAEKRTIKLPDSSTVILNAGSELLLDKDFGRKNRSVSLKGEALFDVQHDAQMPFTVGVEGYDVKVLGTVFNVKAYPGDKKSETSLISGKVEIYLKHTASAYKTLLPKEKFVIVKDLEALPASKAADIKPRTPSTTIMPLSYNRNQVNVETAWSQNRLVFENETFSDIRQKLERWFNVQIIFEDKVVEQYTFTATFEKEDINQVMKALQASYGFKYNIKGKEVKISHQNRR